MARLVLAPGARGALVEQVQRSLSFDERDIDGIYGNRTRDGVADFQRTRELPETGEVDAVTWEKATGLPIPALYDRALALTADFEGHGFGLAQGNFDGAGITWGIIGFTLKHGDIARIVEEVNRRRPDLIGLSFQELKGKLLEVLRSPMNAQLEFADSISIGPRKVKLAEPWLSSFRSFGELDEVKAEQLKLGEQNYFVPALATAKRFGLKSELGVALAFDIHVQNGGVKKAAAARIREKLPVADELELRRLVANVVADGASARFREDVRANDHTHPSEKGCEKVTAILLDFVKKDQTARVWYLK